MAFRAIASIEDLDIGKAFKFEVGITFVAVVRTSQTEVKVVHNTCSHQQYDLAPDAWVEENSIECALHGSCFDLNTGQPDGLPAIAPIPVYASKVEDGVVFVDVGRQLNDAPLPRF
jgi:3-phenylpropionate/trans-cinnamate dioxygenase ferredoxin component